MVEVWWHTFDFVGWYLLTGWLPDSAVIPPPPAAARTVNLSKYRLASSALCGVLDTLHCHPAVTEVYCSFTECGVEGARSMAALLSANSRLVKVFFCSNNITDEGCILLCGALKYHPSLQELELAENNLTAVSARGLSEVLLTNRVLRRLSLYGNGKIGVEGAGCLFEALCINEHLQCLDLGDCGVKSTSVPALVRLFKSNNTLEILSIGPLIWTGNEGCDALDEALQNNYSIQEFEGNYRLITTAEFLQRNAELSVGRARNCMGAVVAMLGIRKLHRVDSGLLRPVPRDVLRYVLGPCIWATRYRVEWNDLLAIKMFKKN